MGIICVGNVSQQDGVCKNLGTAGGAVAPYVAKGVWFDGNNFLSRKYANTATPPGDPLLPNSTSGACSLWFLTGDSVDPLPWFLTTYGIIGSHALFDKLANSAIFINALSIGLEMAPGLYCQGIVAAPPTLQPNTWYHQAMSWNTAFATDQKVFQIFLNGADLGAESSGDLTAGSTPVQWTYYNGSQTASVAVPDVTADGVPAVGMADLHLWVGQFIDWSIPANLAKVRSAGKPVTPSVAVAAFGAPRVLFSGDRNGFGTNQGTAGAYDLLRAIDGSVARASAGAISLPGAVIGQSVRTVINLSDGGNGQPDVAAQFEATISVTDQIQQAGTTGVSAGDSLEVILTGGALTNAASSPSD